MNGRQHGAISDPLHLLGTDGKMDSALVSTTILTKLGLQVTLHS